MSNDEITRLETLVGQAATEIDRLTRRCAEAEAREAEFRALLESRPQAVTNGHAAAWTERRGKIVDDLRAALADLRGE